MKTYLRVLAFARPIARYAVPYFFFSILATAFGLVNFSLLIPLLDVLFNNVSESGLQYMMSEPTLSPNLHYLRELFYYYFAWVIINYGKLGALQFVCVMIVISVLLANFTMYFSRRVLEYMRANTIKNVRKAIYKKVTDLDIGYFSKARKGDVISRTTSDVYMLEHTISNSLDMVFKEPISLIGFFIVLFSISAKLTFFTLLVIPISGVLIGFISRALRLRATQSQETIGTIVSMLDETIGGLRVIKSFNAIAYSRKKFDEENEGYASLMRSMARIRELASPISEFLGVTMVSVILLYGGSLVLAEDSSLSPSAFIAYLILFSQVLRPAKSMATAFSNIQTGLAAAKRIFEILDAEPKIQEKTQAKILENFEQGVEFKNVSFKYEEQWVLKNVNFKIEKGKTVALVGPSGSGKSTTADLIPRFYDIQEGEILIDEHNVKDLTLGSITQHMGIVGQKPILFNDTIFNNIAFGNPNVSMDDVIHAAKVAYSHDFIMEKGGYDVYIGDNGVLLSGGQQQRISIARAVLKNPPLLILDEATASLDNESEKFVQAALDNILKNNTSLVIAHRLSTIKNADEILVLDKGEIIERGTHEELLAKSEGLYKDKLYQSL